MRTPRGLYDVPRRIYHTEMTGCPICGGNLAEWNTLTWQKTIQTMEGVEWIASRPSRCAEETCDGYRQRWGSAEGLQRSPKYGSYGYDVIVEIGIDRQRRRETFGEIGSRLRERVVISDSEVRHLYHQAYLPLLACHERQLAGRLERVIAEQGGLIAALDGLCPEGGEPQLWFLRELTTGLTLRSGWMCQQDQSAFEAFLYPLVERGWPLLGILSDKQRGLVPAVASLFPGTPHHFCQAHYFKNLAEPLSEADQTFKVALRKAVRSEIGEWIRREATDPATPGVLTVTGILPDRVLATDSSTQDTPTQDTPTQDTPTQDTPTPEAERDAPMEDGSMVDSTESETTEPVSPHSEVIDSVVVDVLRRIRYLLTLNGRPPFRLAGIEAYTQLRQLLETLHLLLAHRTEPRLAALAQGLETVLPTFADQAVNLAQGERWLHEIAEILDEPINGSVSGETVSKSLNDHLAVILNQPDVSPFLDDFRRHLATVTRSYAPGLFHCYDIKGLPRTNNGLESHFRMTVSRLLRTTGQKGHCRRTLQRTGAWELLLHFTASWDALMALKSVPFDDLKEERDRLNRHQQRFRMHTRAPRATIRQLQRLIDLWSSLPPRTSA